jgi:hypothetical protein
LFAFVFAVRLEVNKSLHSAIVVYGNEADVTTNVGHNQKAGGESA